MDDSNFSAPQAPQQTPEVRPAPPPPIVPASSGNTAKGTLIGVLIVLVAIGFYLGYAWFQSTWPFSVPTPTPQPSVPQAVLSESFFKGGVFNLRFFAVSPQLDEQTLGIARNVSGDSLRTELIDGHIRFIARDRRLMTFSIETRESTLVLLPEAGHGPFAVEDFVTDAKTGTFYFLTDCNDVTCALYRLDNVSGEATPIIDDLGPYGTFQGVFRFVRIDEQGNIILTSRGGNVACGTELFWQIDPVSGEVTKLDETQTCQCRNPELFHVTGDPDACEARNLEGKIIRLKYLYTSATCGILDIESDFALEQNITIETDDFSREYRESWFAGCWIPISR